MVSNSKKYQILRLGETPAGKEGNPAVSIFVVGAEGIKAGYVADYYRGNLVELDPYDVILVELSEVAFAIHLISRIRAHMGKLLLLKPIYVRADREVKNERLLTMIDGYLISSEDLPSIRSPVRTINNNIGLVGKMELRKYEDRVIFCFLAFIHTRTLAEVVPIVLKEGVYYPILSDIITQNNQHSHITRVLDRMETEVYLDGRYMMSSYLCSQCLADHLLYREVCPSCHSSKLKSEELVHHFRCAHVAPMNEFRKHEDGERFLQCSKCDHVLKHIGVDYDKPSTMHYCDNCQNQFQNYMMMAKCACCSHDQEVEYLVKREFKKYSLTTKGINAVHEGILYVADNEKPLVEDILPWHLFIKSIDYEQTHGRNEKNFLVTLVFGDYDNIIKQIGEQNNYKLIREIIQIIKAAQQSSDFRSVKQPQFFFTLMNMSRESARLIAQRIAFLIQHLLRDNLKLKRVLLTYEMSSFADHDMVESILHASKEDI